MCRPRCPRRKLPDQRTAGRMQQQSHQR